MDISLRLTPVVVVVLLGACKPDPGGAEGETTGESSSSGETATDSGPGTSDSADTQTSTETGETGACVGDECDMDMGDLSGCDVIAQDCPDGLKCVPYSTGGNEPWDDYKCVPVTGTGAAGDPCTIDDDMSANDDCDASSFCFGYNQGFSGGTCHPFCTGSLDMAECIDGWQCLIPAQGPVFCIEACTPLDDQCSDPEMCAWTGSLFTCVPEGAGGAGDACSFPIDCSMGMVCISGEFLAGCADGCCTPYCSLMGGDAPCQAIDPAYTCEPFFMEPMPGFDDLGLCVSI